MDKVYQAIRSAAVGFWSRHKRCVAGGAVLLAAGFVLGLLV